MRNYWDLMRLLLGAGLAWTEADTVAREMALS